MRYAEDHKEKVRASLVVTAAGLVRRDGVAHVSVSDVMKTAGKTVGGFYKHFDSQQALLGEALAEAMRESRDRLLQGLDDLRGCAFEQALVARYLSRIHYHDAEHGCPVAATGSELFRLPPSVRRGLLHEVHSLVDFAAERSGRSSTRTWAIFCACVGTMNVARALGGKPGLRLLDETRETLQGWLGGTA